MSRSDHSDFLDKLIDIEYDKAAAAVRKESMKKTAGAILGPGVPDGTGPMSSTPGCPANFGRGRGRGLGRMDGTGPRGGTPACPVTNAELDSEPKVITFDELMKIKESKDKTTIKLSFFDARQARRNGKFVKIAGRHDLYQDAETNDFWRVSEDRENVVRVFDENNGVVKE